MNSKIIFIVAVVVCALVIGYYVFSGNVTDNTRFSHSYTKGAPLIRDINRSGKPIRLVVNTYDSWEDVTNEYKKHAPNSKNVEVDGFALWDSGPEQSDKQEHICFINVVQLKKIDTKILETWGHELAHCVYGSFHK